MAVYAASKHAVEGFSESVDHEVREHGVRVLLIEPGYTSSQLEANSISPDKPQATYAAQREVARVRTEVVRAVFHLGDRPTAVPRRVLARKVRSGDVVDQTLVGQQGGKTENTFSTGNRKRRPRKGRRYNKYKHARKTCHCFVKGLLITPSGIRIPFSRSYYTREYCEAKNRPYRTQTELAAEMIAELPLPEGVKVVVLGDTAFDAKCIREACDKRKYTWVVPLNPERVLAGPQGKRPKVRSLINGLKADRLVEIRLHAGKGPCVEQRRVSPWRVGSKVKPRTYYVQQRRQAVHSVGEVQLVFSTRMKPTKNRPVEVQKILMTNDLSLSAKQIVEWYALRWQIELFFKELKSTLGFHQYRFRKFDRVEGWDELIQVTFLYLEWHRARQLQRRDLAEEKKKWWRWQRTHGLCMAVRQAAEQADLEEIAERLETPTGLQRLRLVLKRALPKEAIA